MKAARKVKVTPISHLSEDAVQAKIFKMDELRQEMKAAKHQYDTLAAELIAHLGPKSVRQYDQLKFTVIQSYGRTVKWKEEAARLARLLYPHVGEFRKYLKGLGRRYPKKLGKPYARLFDLKDGSDAEE